MDIDVAATTLEQLRSLLVDRLRSNRLLSTTSVEAAMRAIPRHLFVSDATVERAYSDENIVTHRDAGGVAVSSASAPGVVAGMLEQLDVAPGDRVLEIGAGTGYNAALLAHLVGPAGRVTTIDIDSEVVRGARECLANAGCPDVPVFCGDGEFGYPDHAPYDRIVVTAGAWDLPPAWVDQLAPGGRLVVPLRMRGLTRSIAFEREDGYWRSRSIEECGFIPMRGVGGVAERNIHLGGDSGVIVRIDDGQPVDEKALGAALDHPATLVSTGVTVSVTGHLDFWLAGMDGFCRLLAGSRAVDRGLVPPAFGWGSMAVFDQGTFAYLTRSPISDTDDSQWPRYELGVCAYGPGSAELASRVVDRIRAWDRDRRSMTELWIEVHPADTGDVPTGQVDIRKRHTRVIVRTALLADPGVPSPV
ncbi:MAG: methyltransferase, FxLD system [Pseudonocardiaceae bacterium]